MENENQEVEQPETNPLHDLIQHSLDQDYNNANKVFNDIMQVKLSDVLDQEKIKLANQLYNGEPAEADDTIGDGEEEQLNLDLETDQGDSEDGGEVSSEGESSSEDEETEEESSADVEVEVEDEQLSDQGSDDGEDEI
tara:strand:+ start:6902 stop:7315 length:414 start_codon:yes stop_codon:yes gene_type:complete